MVIISPPRLPRLSQPVKNNSPRLSSLFIDISPQQFNQSLHYYDQDVVRELSIPPEHISSGPSRYQLVNGFNPYSEQSTAETPRFPFQIPQHVSSINFQQTRPRTPPVNLLLHHGLPSSLPPPPRTTFVAESSIPDQQESSELVQILDSLLRGSYSNMLANKNDTSVTGAVAPAVENQQRVSIEIDITNLDDILRPNVCEDYLTSPQLEQSPDETPFIDTPLDEGFSSPSLMNEDGSFNFDGMPPPFGSIISYPKETCLIPAMNTAPAPPSESFDWSPYITSPLLNTASCLPDTSKVEPVTPALPSLEEALYTIPETPTLSPSVLLAPAQPPMPIQSNTPSVSASSKSRLTKPLPTGIRRGITPSSLLSVEAPTQPRQYVTPSTTSRKLIPAAFKAKKRARSEVADEEEVEGEGEISLDPTTKDAIEAKRRQNTLAARRSRQRKLEHVLELEDSLTSMTRDRDMWMARAYQAENKLRAHGIP